MILLYCDSGLVNLDLAQRVYVHELRSPTSEQWCLAAKMSNGGTVVLADYDSWQDANLALVRLSELLAEHTPSDGNVLYAESLLSQPAHK